MQHPDTCTVQLVLPTMTEIKVIVQNKHQEFKTMCASIFTSYRPQTSRHCGRLTLWHYCFQQPVMSGTQMPSL